MIDVKKIWRNLKPGCPKCKNGKLRHLGTEPFGKWNIGIEIYECDLCKTEFV